MRLCVRVVSSRFIFLPNTGIKGVHHYRRFLWQTTVATGIKVCVRTAWFVKLISVALNSGKLYLLKYKRNAITNQGRGEFDSKEDGENVEDHH